MFSSRGLFKDVPCPSKHECTLPNCLFKHEEASVEPKVTSDKSQVHNSTAVRSSESPPPAKRRRLDTPEAIRQNDTYIRQTTIQGKQPPQKVTANVLSHDSQPSSQQAPAYLAHGFSINGSSTIASEKSSTTIRTPASSARANRSDTAAKQPASVTRAVSPPPTSRTQKASSPPPKPYRKPADKRGLNPRQIEQSPVKFETRHAYLKKLHKQIEDANNRHRKDFSTQPELILSKEELETQALDDEERIANAYPNPDTYKNNLAHRLAFYTPKKMTAAIWKDTITTTWLTNPNLATLTFTPQKPIDKAATGLSTEAQEVTVLKHLRTGLHQHAKHGYIIKAPDEKAISAVRALQKSNGHNETCDRCGTRFQVFPGRSDPSGQGRLTTKGPCRYHWGRIPRYNGATRGNFPCCGSDAGTEGCQLADHHVFKVSDAARLASLLQFKETPHHNDGRIRGPIVFDCEMSYTSRGLELIRLTALSWPTHTTVLDILVRPIGEILDFNTRFSGVNADMYLSAPDYGHEGKPPKYGPGEPLQIVASPAAARDLLFDHLDPDTPLLGHAIDNDLNACRIIHPFVIDTVLLYPHPKGLPIRYKLRDLARVHLDRRIQENSGDGSEGHDSKEDSAATGDLVRKKVGQKWEELKRSGWWWKGEMLMPPGAAKGLKGGSSL
ncbi:RNA exonuclease 3 [Knufia obscura]|uniref:RNA exonuclease 3 n=1 Tax=Knufia obscura TaxID=1635080 RepID=A0ABR0RUI4_9EURO|nr:RNA exonuclease 3 [Knufia obscura]